MCFLPIPGGTLSLFSKTISKLAFCFQEERYLYYPRLFVYCINILEKIEIRSVSGSSCWVYRNMRYMENCFSINMVVIIIHINKDFQIGGTIWYITWKRYSLSMRTWKDWKDRKSTGGRKGGITVVILSIVFFKARGITCYEGVIYSGRRVSRWGRWNNYI